MKKEEKSLLREAIREIKQLREANHLMGLRLKMFDDIISIFRARETGQGLCMGEDVVWKMEKTIEAAEYEEKSIQTTSEKSGKSSITDREL